MTRSSLFLLLLLVVTLARCGSGSPGAAAPPSAASPPADPDARRTQVLEQLRHGLQEPQRLSGGAGSRAELVEAFVTAINVQDTAALRSMAMDRAEFAYLYYPGSPQAHPPYELDADVMWLTISQTSARGLRRLLQERAGEIRLVGYSCDSQTSVQGENIVHGPCAVRWRSADGNGHAERLFGLILEREGHFKFVSYANHL